MTPLVCSRCRRANPQGALYCHFDGLALGGNEAPLDVGARPFAASFVFPSGRSCRSLDELLLAAEELRDETRELLRDGTLGIFFGGIGRADLARIALQARGAADLDRALDDLLDRFPGNVRKPPRLIVTPLEINLGRIRRTESRTLRITLSNDGMSVLRGSIVSNSPWLMIGEPPGAPDKMFECRRTLEMSLEVIGNRLKASSKPHAGNVLVDSSGGTALVVVLVEVPPLPFNEGVLAGAKSPRQLAEKAKGALKESAPLFERGQVRSWYEANGWSYPIRGPQAAGLAALQQFFEALGLTSPPRLDISELTVKLQGPPGATLEHSLKVTTKDNRPVFAFATSSADWLSIDRISCKGTTAKIKLVVPKVPDEPGESLLSRVQIEGNGGQRFMVAVSLWIPGTRRARPAEPALKLDTLDPSLVLPMGSSLTPDMPISPSQPSILILDDEPESEPDEPVFAVLDSSPEEVEAERRPNPRLLLIAAPVVVLLVLIVAVVHDLGVPRREPKPPSPTFELLDPEPRLAFRIHLNRNLAEPSLRFGLVLPREVDPADAARLKRLTFDELGRTNNTCLRIDEAPVLFGANASYRPRGKETEGFDAVWQSGSIEVTQRVEIVPDLQSRLLDTCLIRYILVNKAEPGSPPRRVGLRMMLDTHVGTTDGTPWLVPGRAETCATTCSLSEGVVPEFIETMEKDDFAARGVVPRLHLRVGRGMEAPSRVLIGAWPAKELARFGSRLAKGNETLWDVPALPMDELRTRVLDLVRAGEAKPEAAAQARPNCAVTLYWDEKPLAPEARREVGFAYGLGSPSADATGRLLLTMHGRYHPSGEIVLCGLVKKPQAGEKLTLKLPERMDMLAGTSVEQVVPPSAATSVRPIGVVTWRIRPKATGTYPITIRSSTGAAIAREIVVQADP